MDIYDPQFRELLSAFQDGELDDLRAAEITELIETNADAREMFEQFERLRTMSDLSLCPSDDELADAVRGKAEPTVQAHVQQCAACLASASQAREMRGAPVVPAAAPETTIAPAASAAAITRRCGRCGKSISVDESEAGQPVQCLGCGEEVPPGIGETIQRAETAKQSDLSATAVAWIVSLILHLLLLIGVGGMTMGTGSGEGDGLEVGIVGDDGTEIETGDAKLEKIQSTKAELQPMQVQPTQIQPIKGVEATAQSGREAILALDMGAGMAAQAAGGDWSSFSAAAGGGGGGASFFGLQARGKNFAYVVDYSGSMEGSRLQAAKSELIRSISALKRNMKFFIVFYDDRFVVMPGGMMLKCTEANKRRLFGWVDRVRSGGGTDPSAAMEAALALKPDAVWLLSDGEFDESACNVIHQANQRVRAQIHTVGFQGREGERLLKRIAEQNNGRYRYVP